MVNHKMITSMLIKYYLKLDSSIPDVVQVFSKNLKYQVKYMYPWQCHFKNKIPMNCSFTKWQWTNIMDLEPWRPLPLNIRLVDNQPSRNTLGNFLEKSTRPSNVFQPSSKKLKIVFFFSSGVAQRVASHGAFS